MGPIPPNSDLIFTVELLRIVPPPKGPEAFAGKPVKTEKRPDGLEIMDYSLGKGAEAAKGKTVSVHYTGTLEDGTVFDSSLKRGKPITFPLGAGRVIKGWDEGIVGMKVGGTRKIVIPAELGYGERGKGKIPANSNLTFTLELMDVQ